jgi:kynurenine formamidase
MTLAKNLANVQSISLGSHTGTHIDAPFHFFADGRTVDKLDLDMLVAPAIVIDARGKQARDKITWEKDLASYAPRLKAGMILLFCTGWSKFWGQATYQITHISTWKPHGNSYKWESESLGLTRSVRMNSFCMKMTCRALMCTGWFWELEV